MKSNNLIAISGFKNSGKDTASLMVQYLLNSPPFMHNYWMYKKFNRLFISGKYKVTSFAYPLKRTLSALLNVPIEKFNDRDFKENYYIFFPTLEITNVLPENAEIISDNKFSKMVGSKDFSFIQTTWITIRQLLQVFGTECMRGIFGDKLWILSTIKDKNPIIISDLRFKVELKAVKDRGGKVIYINRKDCKPGNHASEKEIQEMLENLQYDAVIFNDGSLEDLFNKLKKALNEEERYYC